MSAALESLIFEPHSAYGAIDPDDGQPFPYGYISKPGPMPLFELRTLLAFSPEELGRYATVLSAAPDLLEALKETLATARRNEAGAFVQRAEAAIRKAEGRQP